MKVEIWSDVVCPWCYIGRRRFEKALAGFDHRDQVEVIWRSFQLDPDAPLNYAGSVNDMLAERYGISLTQAENKNAQVAELAALEGLEYHLEKAHPVNSLDAHRLLHLAVQYHLQSEMKERLQKAYFTEGKIISDQNTLVQLAVEVGLDETEVRQVLTSDAFSNEVQADIRRAQALGCTGVPFFVFDQKYAVSGAQPVKVFLKALENTWSDSHKG